VAAIQPAAPPPTTTMRLNATFMPVSLLSVSGRRPSGTELVYCCIVQTKNARGNYKNRQDANKNRQAAQLRDVPACSRVNCDPIESGNRQLGFGNQLLGLCGHNIDH
jgi:hypothetical protein